LLTQQKIFWFWLPLAASWTLMMLQGTIIQGTIARLPEAKTMLAAAGVVISVAVTIESPIIMVLATTTALTDSPQAYRLLRRFVLHLNILLTLIAALIAFVDPVYSGLIEGLMGIPPHIAQVAQPGLQIMTFWSAAIGWRRFYQGILIRFEQTRHVGYGTAVRLSAIGAAAVTVAIFTDLPGVVVAGCAWMSGVTSEMIYAYFAARPVIATHLSAPAQAEEPPLLYSDVVKYHAPLAATSLLSLLAQPMIGAGLARMAFPEENLAAWPVIFTVLLFFRSLAFALPETVIALFKKPAHYYPLRRFCLAVAAGSSLAIALVVFSPLIMLYLLYVTAVSTELVTFIVPGVIAGLLIPALHALQSWLRGVLMVAKITGDIYWGMGVNLLATGLGLGTGILWQAPGAPTAAVALSLGMVAEIIYLWWRVKPAQARLRVVLGRLAVSP